MVWPWGKAPQLKKIKGELLCPTATINKGHFILPTSIPCLSCLLPLGRSIRSLSRASFAHSLRSLHNLCLHGIGPADLFCGGKAEPAHACCSCAPCPRRLPPHPPHACSGAPEPHRLVPDRKDHRLARCVVKTGRMPEE